MSEAEKYLKNAENCIELAEQAKTAPAQARYELCGKVGDDGMR
jgi:hypothetical protein